MTTDMNGMKMCYEAPSMNVLEVNLKGLVCLSNGVNASRSGYGTASTADGTEQTWD